MTDEDKVDLGLFSLGLLNHDSFNRLVHLFERQTALAILSTKPDDAKLREALYAEHQGLGQFLGYLKSIVKEAERLTAEQPPETATVDDDEEPLPNPFD